MILGPICYNLDMDYAAYMKERRAQRRNKLKNIIGNLKIRFPGINLRMAPGRTDQSVCIMMGVGVILVGRLNGYIVGEK